MNIVLLSDVSAARVSCGMERMLREQALGLTHLGHRVQIIARMPADDVRPHVRIGPVDEWRFAVSGTQDVSILLSAIRRSLDVFDRVVQSARPDIVLIHHPLAGLGPIMMRRGAARTWATLCHGLSADTYGASYVEEGAQESTHSGFDAMFRAATTRGRYWVEQLVLARSSRVIVLSEWLRDQLVAAHALPSRRIWQIPDAADPERFRPPSDRAGIRQTLGWSGTKTVLFTVRRFVRRRGLEQLVDAMGMLGEDARDVMLVIGGDGPLRSSIEERIAARGLSAQVALVGYIPEERLSQYYQGADLVVVPAPQLDGSGLVTLEALACRTPVLGTPVGALPEILRRIDAALVTDGADAASLAEGIRRVLRRFADQPGEQDRLARKGRVLVERELNWAHHCVNLESVLLGDQRQQFRAA